MNPRKDGVIDNMAKMIDPDVEKATIYGVPVSDFVGVEEWRTVALWALTRIKQNNATVDDLLTARQRVRSSRS